MSDMAILQQLVFCGPGRRTCWERSSGYGVNRHRAAVRMCAAGVGRAVDVAGGVEYHAGSGLVAVCAIFGERIQNLAPSYAPPVVGVIR